MRLPFTKIVDSTGSVMLRDCFPNALANFAMLTSDPPVTLVVSVYLKSAKLESGVATLNIKARLRHNPLRRFMFSPLSGMLGNFAENCTLSGWRRNGQVTCLINYLYIRTRPEGPADTCWPG